LKRVGFSGQLPLEFPSFRSRWLGAADNLKIRWDIPSINFATKLSRPEDTQPR
jgi:hypothetical protein